MVLIFPEYCTIKSQSIKYINNQLFFDITSFYEILDYSVYYKTEINENFIMFKKF